ncbi:hypothetical protein FKM82_001772 [Ascaphus truei]
MFLSWVLESLLRACSFFSELHSGTKLSVYFARYSHFCSCGMKAFYHQMHIIRRPCKVLAVFLTKNILGRIQSLGNALILFIVALSFLEQNTHQFSFSMHCRNKK